MYRFVTRKRLDLQDIHFFRSTQLTREHVDRVWTAHFDVDGEVGVRVDGVCARRKVVERALPVALTRYALCIVCVQYRDHSFFSRAFLKSFRTHNEATHLHTPAYTPNITSHIAQRTNKPT